MSDQLLQVLSRAPSPSRLIGWRAGVAVSEAEFRQRALRWRALFALHAGQHFALYLEDSIEFAAVLLAAWDARKTIWLSADTLTTSISALTLSVDGFIGAFPAECQPLLPDEALPLSEVSWNELDANLIGLVVHTSGSTGVAQAIPKKLAQLASEVATLEQLFGARLGQAEIIATVSHQHIYGLLFKLLWPLASGRALHAWSLQYPEQLVEVLACRRCVLISSPAHLKRLPTHLSWSGTPAAIFSSGGSLAAEVSQATAALLGSTPIEIFGSSETGGVAWRVRSDGEVWSVMPQVEWRIAADSLLELKSPHLLTADWLLTADCVQTVQTGGFLLQGRADRIVKIEEKRVSLQLVEHTLLSSPLVSEAKLLLCQEDQVHSQRQYLAAVLVLSATGQELLSAHGRLALNEALKQVLQHRVEAIAVPRKWRYVEQLPMDSQGKVTQVLLQNLFIATSPATLLHPACQVLQQEATRASLQVCWPKNSRYFSGHFPGFPILPGVAQVDWAIQIGRQLFSLPTNFTAIHALKFQHVILPDQPVELLLTLDVQKKSLNLSYSSAGRQHSSGRIMFTDSCG